MSARRPTTASSTSGAAAISALAALALPPRLIAAKVAQVEHDDDRDTDVASFWRLASDAVRSHLVVIDAAASATTRAERDAVAAARSALIQRTCAAAFELANPIPF